MALISKVYADLPDHPSTFGEYDSHVVVEVTKAHGDLANLRLIKCYIPAEAWVDKKSGHVNIRYETCFDGYDLYYSYWVYDIENMPNLYKRSSMGLKECLLLALGVLLGYDEEEDCFKPFLDYVDENGENVYLKWPDLSPWKDNWKKWTEINKGKEDGNLD